MTKSCFFFFACFVTSGRFLVLYIDNVYRYFYYKLNIYILNNWLINVALALTLN